MMKVYYIFGVFFTKFNDVSFFIFVGRDMKLNSNEYVLGVYVCEYEEEEPVYFVLSLFTLFGLSNLRREFVLYNIDNVGINFLCAYRAVDLFGITGNEKEIVYRYEVGDSD